MSQKSIKSFFTITPKKTAEMKEETKDESPSSSPKKNDNTMINESPPVTNGKEKRTSRRQRLESSDEESQSPKPTKRKSSPTSSEKKKNTKRQRIESSESEAGSPVKVEEKIEVKIEKTHQPKTYASPKSKKTKATSTKDKISSSVEKKTLREKNEKTSPAKKSPTKLTVKEEISPTQKKIVPMSAFVKKENGVGEKKDGEVKKEGDRVPEEEYNPAKPKYHPIDDACWSKGEEVPYLALAKTLEAIEAISARLKIVEILANFFRSVLALTPEDLLPCVYMCLNQLAPAYHSLELGMAETYLMKTIGQCTGRTLAQVKSAAQKTGDLGLVAEQARATQRTMFTPPPLKARKVFAALKEVAHMTGQASVNKKIAKIQSLYIACRNVEARYLIRSLEGKLRIGLAEQSVLQALAVATTLTPPGPNGVETLDASKGLSAEQLKAKIDEQALIIKTTYCECPNYELLVPALLQHGVQQLQQHCRLTPGIPLKPMLAHPTKGLHEVFNRFENQEFTCEWKYDGERAQIHVPAVPDNDTPDFSNAAVFSRNQENNTSKYPDILRRLPTLLKPGVHSCVLDTEAVAYDVEKKQILPFQILSTRKRKDANEADIKVQVCVFVFDLLYLNGRALVRQPLAERRALLKEHFHEVEGEWQFATSRDCTSMEEVQQFLDESIKGSCEGLMVKMLQGENSRYDIARRSHNWLKLKKDYLEGVGDSIDAVVIGAYLGRGKRTGVYGGFLLACCDGSGEEYQALCKIGTGFTDEGLKARAEELEPHIVSGPKSYYRFDASHTPDVWFEPARVWEVRCADLSLSPAHRAAIGLVDPDKGISLRFPRFIRVRDDKTPEEATTAQQIASMYLAQDQVKNTGTKITNLDDFY
ncbi:DNA ligase 1 isoform X2 [Pectinophora gossypiella]|nr:DNA ligase 1 isoform X2 [Pectinophora gossypiella]XP_049879857.1 DNA ligase 1 isoform X2 [Pectinophora gossypiella]